MVIKFISKVIYKEVMISCNLGKIAHGPVTLQGDEDEGLYRKVELTGESLSRENRQISGSPRGETTPRLSFPPVEFRCTTLRG